MNEQTKARIRAEEEYRVWVQTELSGREQAKRVGRWIAALALLPLLLGLGWYLMQPAAEAPAPAVTAPPE